MKNRFFQIQILVFLNIGLLALMSCSVVGGISSSLFFDYAEFKNTFQQQALDFPDRLIYDELRMETDDKWSDSVLQIPVLIISDHVDKDENEPEILITGGIHGNESLSMGVAVEFANWLLFGGEEADLLRSQYEFYILPVLNPEGFKSTTRYNPAGVDLNRNFDWAWESGVANVNGISAVDQPETQLLVEFCQKRRFTLIVNGHTGAENINGLWDYIGTENSGGDPKNYSYEEYVSLYQPAYPLILEAGIEYAELLKSSDGFSRFYYTQGYDWYAAYGTFSDWVSAVRGGCAYTIEYSRIQDILRPDDNDLDRVWNAHKKALIQLVSYANRGVSGRVIDKVTSIPYSGKVVVKRIQSDSRGSSKDPVEMDSFAYTDPSFGDFHLMVPNGHYQLLLYSPDNIVLYQQEIDVEGYCELLIELEN